MVFYSQGDKNDTGFIHPETVLKLASYSDP